MNQPALILFLTLKMEVAITEKRFGEQCVQNSFSIFNTI